MKNKHCLFICNTVYQVLVALWIANHVEGFKDVDFFISDHMNGGKQIADRINKLNNGCRGIFVETKEYVYKANSQNSNNKYARMINRLYPARVLRQFVELTSDYRRVYFANMDRFTELLVNVVECSAVSRPELILMEDGISTYSKAMESRYKDTIPRPGHTLKSKVLKHMYREYPIYGHIKYALVFNTELMTWTPSKNRRLDKIDVTEGDFLNIVNNIFGYHEDAAEYDRKYVFFEEAFLTDGIKVNDIQMVEALAKHVGKDNIIVKIHPRNPINRFREAGYKTNTNTSIPWEVICMNMADLEEKKLITISSNSILTPVMLLGKK